MTLSEPEERRPDGAGERAGSAGRGDAEDRPEPDPEAFRELFGILVMVISLVTRFWIPCVLLRRYLFGSVFCFSIVADTAAAAAAAACGMCWLCAGLG